MDASDPWTDLDFATSSDTDPIYQLDRHRRNISLETDSVKSLVGEIQDFKRRWYLTEVETLERHFRRMQKIYYGWKELRVISDSHDNVERALVLYLTKLCYCYDCRDSREVARLLQHFYDCFGTFSLFYRAKVVTDAEWKTFSEPDLWPVLSPTFELPPLGYFVRHASLSRCFFDGCRMIDYFVVDKTSIPTYFYALDLTPDLFLLFTRHGALCGRLWRVENARLLRSFLTFLGEESSHQVEQRVQMIKIMLRIIPQARTTRDVFDEFDDEIFWERLKALSTKALPDMLERFARPSKLKHLCRCAIRECLLESSNLPDGIYRLPVLPCLYSYLDITED